MSETGRVKEAIVNVIKDTCHFAVEDGKCNGFDNCPKENCAFAQEQVDNILSLKWPDGSPMLVVRSQDQSLPFRMPGALRYPISHELVESMLKAGWVKKAEGG